MYSSLRNIFDLLTLIKSGICVILTHSFLTYSFHCFIVARNICEAFITMRIIYNFVLIQATPLLGICLTDRCLQFF